MNDTTYEKGTFGYDLNFLKKYIDPIVLSDSKSRSRVILSKEWQGRVMTSTASGSEGKSFGWVNYDLIQSGEIQEHINVFGGEDRFWLGPEGGQFSIYFEPGASFDFEHWFVPKQIDTEPFDLIESGSDFASFQKAMQIQNYSGFNFNFVADRSVFLLDKTKTEKELSLEIPEGLDFVGISVMNSVTNTGEEEWTKETGMLSIWILSMFTPSPGITIAVPYKVGEESSLGAVVNDSYFGKISEDRLKVDEGIIYFRGDGKSRGKIGLSPRRALPVACSYDEDNNVLTLVRFSLHEGVTDYVNSMWELQDKPFEGDAVNSYNDGPLEDGSQMGPFYELESSSPAANLKPGESMVHIHSTFHFQGDEALLDQVVKAAIGIGLEQIKNAF
ncbi:MAG: hypothetical protein ISS19_05260 [Bacteroidales bacterium]|nr:hypothetical protein [Bacteroidales bacterium]